MAGFGSFRLRVKTVYEAALVLAVSFILLWPAPVSAQVLYGSLVGNVTDPSGGVVANAAVKITNRATGQVSQTVTNDSGSYLFQNVTPGVFDLTVTASGFTTYTRENLNINVNSVLRSDVTLQVGQLAETVTVEAAAVALKTETSDVSAEVTSKEVTDLPLPRYRNYQSLINLVPGATPGRFQNANTDTPARAMQFNVNGTNPNSNNAKIDGASSLLIWFTTHTAYIPSAESIEVVNVATNNFDAEQGMAGGAAVTVQTKSGTNDIHGSAYALHQNSKFAAKDFFFKDARKPKNLVNIDGFTLGGPIKRDKLFYFGSWEGTRERIAYNRLYTIGTPDQNQGNFSAYNTTIYDPSTGALDGTGRTAFDNNIIPGNRQSAVTRKLINLLPAPNQTGFNQNYFNSATDETNRDQFDVKINWNRSPTHMLFGKYGIMDAQVSGEFGLGQAGGQCLCAGGAGTGDTVIQIASFGQTKTFSANLVYDMTIGVTRFGQVVTQPKPTTNFGLEFLGIPGTNGPDPRQAGMPRFEISSYSPLGNIDGWEPIYRNDLSYTTTQNFSLIKGSHNVRFGFEGIRHWLNHWQPELGGGPRGRFDFNDGVTRLNGGRAGNQYNSYSTFVMGLPRQMQKTVQWEKMSSFEWQFGLFVRDRWQVTPKLTLTYGLRWEKYTIPTRGGARPGLEDWDPETNLIALGGNGSIPKNVGITDSNKLLAPRFGFAYRITNETVIRAGYGITIDPRNLTAPLRTYFPLAIGNSFEGVNAFQAFRPIEQGIPEFGGPPSGTERVLLPPTTATRRVTPHELRRGYIQSWNFVVESRLPGDVIGSIGYVGTQQTGLFATYEANAAYPGKGNAGRTYFPKFGRTGDTSFLGGFVSSNYHSLQFAANRRASRGLTVKGAYTYSHAINMTDVSAGNLTWHLFELWKRNRADAGYDQPHILQTGFVYDLPFGPGRSHLQSGLGRWILGDWQINGVFAAFNGRPFNVTSSSSSLNAPGAGTQTADQIKPTVERIGTVDQWFDRTAFAPVTRATGTLADFGTSGRNVLRGPSIVNLDFSAFRDFTLTEKVRLQFRGEIFNLTNTPHFNAPNADSNSGDFMKITSTYGSNVGQDAPNRAIRFALRAYW